MPLVVPGITSSGGSSSDWQNKLLGKKLGDSHNETTFAKKDLPSQHRVVKEGEMSTTDFNPDRLKIHTSNDGTISKVSQG